MDMSKRYTQQQFMKDLVKIGYPTKTSKTFNNVIDELEKLREAAYNL
jgi:hypothetical protein